MSFMDLTTFVYWVSLVCLSHTWGLYGIVLFLWCRIMPRTKDAQTEEAPAPRGVSFIIAARNEERSIRERIENLRELSSGLPWAEVLVGSDGSQDNTCQEVLKAQEQWPEVRLFDFPIPRGRSAVHNDLVRQAEGELLVFTDAETRFDPFFLQYIMPRFRDPKVGAVSGRIHYRNLQDSSITLSAGLYWELEEKLRTLESRLGILAFGTGAAFCMRRELYMPMKAAHDDVDFWETLSVAARGFKVEYEPRAKAFDIISPEIGTTHRLRARRTSRAFRSILRGVWEFRVWQRPSLLFSVLSHKLLRHVSPLLLLLLLTSNLILAGRGSWYVLTLLAQSVLYGLGALGWAAHLKGIRFKPLALPFNFLLLNYSRLLGVLNGFVRKPPSSIR
ncbi:MAG: glycosyltransferase [bacterium]